MQELQARSLRVRTGIVFLLLAVLSCGGSERPGDILLITIDTLRADHLALYGYERATSPSLDRFFRDGAVFERAYSTHAATPPSVASILTGHYPQHHGVRGFYVPVPPETMVLPDLIPPEYQTAGFIGNAVVGDKAMGLAARFDHFDDRTEDPVGYTNNVERIAAPLTDAAIEWLDEERDAKRPLFLWVHYMDPHAPYTPPEDFAGSFDHEGEVRLPLERLAPVVRRQVGQAPEGEVDGLRFVDAYDEEILYTDSEIGRLLASYAETSEIEDALVIVTADHGETLLERDRHFLHGYHVWDELVRVPLLVRGPGVSAGPRAGIASVVDIAPTVLAFARARIPATLPGVDLRDGSVSEDRVVFAAGRQVETHVVAAVSRPRKWVVEIGVKDLRERKRASFDLMTDPAEQDPQEWRPRPGALALEERIARDPLLALDARGRRAGRRKADAVSPRADSAEREKLRALGYVE